MELRVTAICFPWILYIMLIFCDMLIVCGFGVFFLIFLFLVTLFLISLCILPVFNTHRHFFLSYLDTLFKIENLHSKNSSLQRFFDCLSLLYLTEFSNTMWTHVYTFDIANVILDNLYIGYVKCAPNIFADYIEKSVFHAWKINS